MTGHKPDIPDQLREAREAAGMGQEEAGQALGVHLVTVSRWENGKRRPSRANFERAMALYRSRLTDVKPENVPRGTLEVNQPGPWPELIGRFGRVAIRRGATDAEVDFLQAALALPEAETLVFAELAETEAQDPEALFKGAERVFAGLLVWVSQRVRERRAQSTFDVPAFPIGEDPMAGLAGDDATDRQRGQG